MDPLLLSRLQFAVATMFHFIFVPLTLGLSVLIACMETIYVRTGNQAYLRMVKFWGKIFLINFAIGIVTGITLEFQFGTNWSRYSTYVGDIFGPLLAIEASVAFFLESVFIGVWIFGWKKISPRAHAVVMWLVALAGTVSAVWILTANAWMQHPVGYVFRNGRAELNDFMAVVTQPFAILEIIHTLGAAYIVGAFFVMGISAYHILHQRNTDLFVPSFKIAAVFALVFSFFIVAEGHIHGADLAHSQPSKLAALEAHWETSKRAPVYLFTVADDKNERNIIEIGKLPGGLSLLAFHDINAEVRGLKDFPRNERPPVLITSMSFKIMVALGGLFCLLSAMAFFFRNRLESVPWFLRLMVLAIPLPFISTELGWVVAEVGRQPWIVYGLMKTSDAVSTTVSAGQVAVSLAAFVLVYGAIGAVGIYLMTTNAIKGPVKGE